jgi:hypothetical protein
MQRTKANPLAEPNLGRPNTFLTPATNTGPQPTSLLRSLQTLQTNESTSLALSPLKKPNNQTLKQQPSALSPLQLPRPIAVSEAAPIPAPIGLSVLSPLVKPPVHRENKENILPIPFKPKECTECKIHVEKQNAAQKEAETTTKRIETLERQLAEAEAAKGASLLLVEEQKTLALSLAEHVVLHKAESSAFKEKLELQKAAHASAMETKHIESEKAVQAKDFHIAALNKQLEENSAKLCATEEANARLQNEGKELSRRVSELEHVTDELSVLKQE